MKRVILILLSFLAFSLCRPFAVAQSCGGGCSNSNCACCDCSGNCLIDSYDIFLVTGRPPGASSEIGTKDHVR